MSSVGVVQPNKAGIWRKPLDRLSHIRSANIAQKALGYGAPVAAMLGSTVMLDERQAGNDLVNHAPSMLPSFTIGAIGGVLTDRLSDRLRRRGRNSMGTATKIGGRVVTGLVSVAYQLAAETNLLYAGTNDWKDLAIGAMATVPGIWVADNIRNGAIDDMVTQEASSVVREAILATHNAAYPNIT
jgi:hypothetical protein